MSQGFFWFTVISLLCISTITGVIGFIGASIGRDKRTPNEQLERVKTAVMVGFVIALTAWIPAAPVVDAYYYAFPPLGKRVIVEGEGDEVIVTPYPEDGFWRSDHPGAVTKDDLQGAEAYDEAYAYRPFSDGTHARLVIEMTGTIVDLGKYYRDQSRLDTRFLSDTVEQVSTCVAQQPELAAIIEMADTADLEVNLLALEQLNGLIGKCGKPHEDGILLRLNQVMIEKQPFNFKRS